MHSSGASWTPFSMRMDATLSTCAPAQPPCCVQVEARLLISPELAGKDVMILLLLALCQGHHPFSFPSILKQAFLKGLISSLFVSVSAHIEDVYIKQQ